MASRKTKDRIPADKSPNKGPNPTSKPVCGAKLRNKDKTCRSTILCPNGRCRLHGGLTPRGPANPNFKDGHRSKYLYMPERLTTRVETFVGTVIENLEESIRIQQSLEADLHAQLDTGESPNAWKALLKLVDDFNKTEGGITIGQFVYGVQQIANGALGQSSLIAQIQSIHETQRKLTESLTKCRKDIQETFTEEQWHQLLNVVANAVSKAGPEAFTLFQKEIELYKSRKQVGAS